MFLPKLKTLNRIIKYGGMALATTLEVLGLVWVQGLMSSPAWLTAGETYLPFAPIVNWVAAKWVLLYIACPSWLSAIVHPLYLSVNYLLRNLASITISAEFASQILTTWYPLSLSALITLIFAIAILSLWRLNLSRSIGDAVNRYRATQIWRKLLLLQNDYAKIDMTTLPVVERRLLEKVQDVTDSALYGKTRWDI